jgi:CheY-like chemotaxis protein
VSLLILVVDDEPDVETLFRQQFRRDLRDGRFTMEFAQSGPAALQRITDAARVSLILILSDINMPGMSGLDLLPKARAARPDVPIIMITAYGDAETKRKALEGGAEALLTSQSTLQRCVMRLICGLNALLETDDPRPSAFCDVALVGQWSGPSIIAVYPVRIGLVAKPSIGSRAELDLRGAGLAHRLETAKGVYYSRPIDGVEAP